MATPPGDPKPPSTIQPISAAPDASVAQLWARVAAEWGIDFESPPPAVADALPELIDVVKRTGQRLADAQQRRSLAAALAALAHQIQAGALFSMADDGADDVTGAYVVR